MITGEFMPPLLSIFKTSVTMFFCCFFFNYYVVAVCCLITDNVIKENQWGGVDIRRGGDPILRNNFICHGYSDGVVVGERGRGLIEGNHVYCV